MKNWTPDERLLFNAFLSFLGSAATGAASAGYQQWSTGVINPGVVLNVVLLAFITLLGKSLYDYVPSHITQELRALRDFQSQWLGRAQVAQPAQPQSPLVVIHTQNATPLTSSASNASTILTIPAAAAQSMTATPVVSNAVTYVPPQATIPAPTPGDVLGDLPATAATLPDKITGVVPVYGASGK